MNTKGFTLLEMVLAVGVGIAVLLLLTTIFRGSLNIFGALGTETTIQENSRRAIYKISSDLRQSHITSVQIPASPNNNQIAFDVPVFQVAAGSCSAQVTNPLQNTPVACTNNADCANSCGSGTCFRSICHKLYTYALSQANGLSQLTCSATGENNRAIGNGVQLASFQNNAMDPNLGTNEIRIQLTAQGRSSYENRVRNATNQAVVSVRN